MMLRDKSALLLWAGILLLTTLFLYLRLSYRGFDQVLFGDNDDAMRMVVVRDFLNGQNWFDHAQYRMNTPFGGDMHWSRMIDLPIAALVLLARPFAGAGAEVVAGFAWPIILLGVFIWFNGLLAQRLVGPAGMLPAMLITAFSVVTYSEFDFGRIDHHSVQIILTQLAVLFSIHALSRPRMAGWAGLAVATSLAIGTETLPVVVAAILVYGLQFVIAPRFNMGVRWFGLSFGLGSVGHLLLAAPPSLWLVPACDALSVVYASAALASGLGLAALTLLSLRGWHLRLIGSALAGGVVLALVVWLFPACLDGPYAIVDPWLVEHWLAGIGEAMPLPEVLMQQPVYVLGASMPAFIALACVLHAVWRSEGDRRVAWLVLLAFLAIIIAVAFVQVRSMRITVALISPACAYCVVMARRRYLEKASLLRIGGLVASWLGFAGILWSVMVHLLVSAMPAQAVQDLPELQADAATCLAPGAYDGLKGMGTGGVMAPMDMGAYILLYTGHDIVAAPYHRNNAALLDTYAFFNGPIAAARDILTQRGITLVATCDGLPEMAGLPDAADDSFVRLAQQNALPDWLKPVSAQGQPITIYAVKTE
ncbi:MAG: hypothetical protein P0Y65_04935 [Candidatus Devosia phytovorans]|uniref:Uncharacterized protein n=1 Tax=Candidatus Devosia phytovorans TaxID=3121372 RepID=A0AAJ6B1Q2_9HYPH|nr:hypothetical protein [Devosia sp.]WEK05604.1 MAG: hypothetical protein P0Y65_04935 [Devosia sp.]